MLESALTSRVVLVARRCLQSISTALKGCLVWISSSKGSMVRVKALVVDILLVLGCVVLFPVFIALGGLLAVLQRWSWRVGEGADGDGEGGV